MEQPPQKEEKKPAPFTPEEISQARNHIAAILQNIEREGAVDSERDAFNNILARLEQGEVGPKMAVEEALDIQNRRQDYR